MRRRHRGLQRGHPADRGAGGPGGGRGCVLSGPAALTPTERRVAELAATDKTNREIAQLLFVTVKTVEIHLGNAYHKLGVRGRRQLSELLATSPR